MSWAVGYDSRWDRDIGYGVPAACDYPGCPERIDRGLAYVCGGEPYGGEEGCGLYFCDGHMYLNFGEERKPQRCKRCQDGKLPFHPAPDLQEWLDHKETDTSWARWRAERVCLPPARSRPDPGPELPMLYSLGAGEGAPLLNDYLRPPEE